MPLDLENPTFASLLQATTSGSDVGQTTAIAGKGGPVKVTTKGRDRDEGSKGEPACSDVPEFADHDDPVEAVTEQLQSLGFTQQVIDRVRLLLKTTSPSFAPASDSVGSSPGPADIPIGRWSSGAAGVATMERQPVGGLPVSAEARVRGILCVGGLRAPSEPTVINQRPRIQLEADAPVLGELIGDQPRPEVELVQPVERERAVYEAFAQLALETIGRRRPGLNPAAPRLQDVVRTRA